ncbi:MAG: cytochrome c biogenesis protein ResB [Verrucomicrobia bacterium]|nr:cytochrome c biogenesis protein ResB [Verrucomicrobiota bacterium]MDE3099691.1 cytochrome c biogenesis protein ResB [Verrucomicrobiota bacterium]
MKKAFDIFVKVLISLRLTVVLLAFAIIIVFVGTLAQVDEGLFRAQSQFFRQWLVFGLDLMGWKIPVILPGGYLIGVALLANLIAAHVYRFQFTVRKAGIQLAHAGVIVLLLGQLCTDMLARESVIQLFQGETKSWSESARQYELAFLSDAGSNAQNVVAIPAAALRSGAVIRNPNLPFTIRVERFWQNSSPAFRAPMLQNGPPAATNGVARNFDFQPTAPSTSMDDKNVPTALISILAGDGPLGDWVVSGWTGDDQMIQTVRESYTQQAGAQMAQKVIQQLTQPQSVVVGGRKFTFLMRPRRVYFPDDFSMTLLKATHNIYPGTDIPEHFQSLVRVKNPRSGEDRQVLIYMNAPLRYEGLTFYQYQMDAGQATLDAGRTPSSVFQVVHNPTWLTPYAGCVMVAMGLTIQFMFHLVGFMSKRKAK